MSQMGWAVAGSMDWKVFDEEEEEDDCGRPEWNVCLGECDVAMLCVRKFDRYSGSRLLYKGCCAKAIERAGDSKL